MKRRALVSHIRMPEVDRDSGSVEIDFLVRCLVDDGWSVTFLADQDKPVERHAHRLRQLGVATYAGYSHAADIIAAGQFDLALVAFWHQASRLMPLLRQQSPRTKLLIHSVDVHFLRDARRRFGVDGRLDAAYGAEMAEELNTYHDADAVLAVSAKETALLADFLGGAPPVHHLPIGDAVRLSPIPFEDRRGILFVGNFRHLPNGEAVEYLCRDIVPRIAPELLAAHPVSVLGSGLTDSVRSHALGHPDVRMVGWVPSVTPYLERARVSVVPLLHGAGVKRKVIESMMVGTPVVTTAIGAEGLELTDGEQVLIADDAAGFAAAVTRLLVDRAAWRDIADGAAAHIRTGHDREQVRARFLAIVDDVLSAPAQAPPADGFSHGRQRADAYRATVAAVQATVHAVTEPGAIVLVASRGDDALVAFAGRTGWHFPQAPDGVWAGYHPADSQSAISHLEALRARGARYLVLPSTAFWWRQHYAELALHLDTTCARIHGDDDSVLFDLSRTNAPVRSPSEASAPRPTVLVMGTSDDAGPPPDLVAELERSHHFAVTQDTEAEAEWIVTVDDRAVLPPGFLDDFLTVVTAAGASRAQPSHRAGPAAGPPVTERLLGCVAREVDHWSPLPVRAWRRGAEPDGPVLLVDAAPIGLLGRIDGPSPSRVREVFVASPDGPTRSIRRGGVQSSPRISVVIATHNRPDLLASCLAGFCPQSVGLDAFEIVVVDDGSSTPATSDLFDRFAERLPLVWARIDHAGRSAAKNLGVLLARGDIVLFFDDDDRPAADLLAEHLRAHEAAGDEATAVLGFTDWAAELTVTPLMHFITDVDRLLFAYGNLTDGQQLDWRGFWEGRISCKRALLVQHGLHDQRLAYSIDVEMAWRLAARGLKVLYHAAARSQMARPIDLEGFCARIEGKGRAHAVVASLHDHPEIRSYTRIDGAAERWEVARSTLAATLDRARVLEAEEDEENREELYRCYRAVFAAHYAKGLVDGLRGDAVEPSPPPAAPRPPDPPSVLVTGSVGQPVRVGAPVDRGGRADAVLTVTIPVWSRTAGLAEMAQRTIERVWEVARLPTEVVVIDNGSSHQVPLAADVYRYDSNQGVAVAWNAGIALAQAPVIAVLNSDCTVEPGWDEALSEAVSDGRRIAFPYTDHGDALGFRMPDQAGTAGWCFMLTADLYRTIGPFDEQFSPAYCEDTDYWHRAWQLGVELSPVPAARVTHARRTTGRTDPRADWLLQSHRYKYGWKHGVDPLRAPPYYNRPIVDYHGRAGEGATP